MLAAPPVCAPGILSSPCRRTEVWASLGDVIAPPAGRSGGRLLQPLNERQPQSDALLRSPQLSCTSLACRCLKFDGWGPAVHLDLATACSRRPDTTTLPCPGPLLCTWLPHSTSVIAATHTQWQWVVGTQGRRQAGRAGTASAAAGLPAPLRAPPPAGASVAAAVFLALAAWAAALAAWGPLAAAAGHHAGLAHHLGHHAGRHHHLQPGGRAQGPAGLQGAHDGSC